MLANSEGVEPSSVRFGGGLPTVGYCSYDDTHLAPHAGFEPATNRVTTGCSTAELTRMNYENYSELTN